MEKFTIKASFKDCIDGIVGFSNNVIPHWKLTKEVEVDDSSSKEEIIDLFNTCSSFCIEDDYISFTVQSSEEDIAKFHSDQEAYKNNYIRRLKKWFDMEEYREEIESYLIRENLRWILDELTAEEKGIV